MVFSLNHSGFLTSATPESVIPNLEDQLIWIENIEAPELKSNIHRLLAYGYQRKGDVENAKDHYAQALKYNSHQCRTVIAKAFITMGDPKTAVEILEESICKGNLKVGLESLILYINAQVTRMN